MKNDIVGTPKGIGSEALHDVVDSQFTDLREPEPFLITRLPEFKEPWIDPKESIPNYKKHEQTCIKNRKARKKKKRR